jgi:hypothetical protein
VLEGRIELLEQFLPHLRLVHQAVAHREWRGRTLEQLDALRELELSDAAIADALPVALRRLEIEHWPDGDAAVKHVRETARLRERLREFVVERLGPRELETLPPGPLPLATLLDRLRAVVEVPPGVILWDGRRERLLLEARTSPVALFPWWCLPLMAALWAGSLPWVGLSLVALVALARLRNAGLLRLTSTRLMWTPFYGRERFLWLSELRGVRVAPELFAADLLVDDGELNKPVFMFEPAVSARAAALIDVHRRLAIGEEIQPDAPRPERLTCEATLRGDGRPLAGVAVLRPGYVAFLYRKTGPRAVNALAGYGLGTPRAVLAVDEVSLELLVEQLALLPAERFDTLLRRLAREHGALFPVHESEPRLDGDRLSVESAATGLRVDARVDETRQPRARRLLAAWEAAREESGASAAG